MNLLEIKNLEKFEGFVLLKEITEGITSSGSPFVKLVIADNEGLSEAMIWDTKKEQLEVETGDIIKIIGVAKTYQDKTNIIISPIVAKDKRVIPVRKILPADKVDLSSVIKSAEEDVEVMINFLRDTVSFFKDEDLKEFTNKILKDFEEDFKYVPGGEKVHHAYKSGLLYHVYRMLKSAIAIAETYQINKDLLCCGVIVHDIGKIPTFNYSKETGIFNSYTDVGVLNGHIIEGIKIIQKYELIEEKKILIEHMISSHHYVEQWGSFTAPSFKEAELLHHLDMIDSRLSIMEEELNKIDDENSSSSRIWALEKRKIFKIGK